ncbi:MAG: sn-glycerol-1-phosphate dehydrogenase [Clostridia bacterium]|nr:sn-glycerol-1-phosphate dehydrogenase [Clostridia bacterium]
MEINEMLKGVACAECGRMHTCPIKEVYIERDAVKNYLANIAADYESILIVADENTYSVSGKDTENALCQKKVKNVIFSGKSVLIPNEQAIEKVNEKIEGIDLIVGIGSGVIQDLCKYVSHAQKIPYIIVATAPSMDGYASSGAAMILKGMKETIPAGLPIAIVADTEVLKNAPMEMIRAGYGDIIGKYSALNDWRLANVVNKEPICSFIYNTTYEMIEKTKKTATGLTKRDEKSVKTLMEALIVVGVMMSFLGNSRPASGSEHHLSHFFEITGIVKGKPYLAHGIDVAYSTVVTADLRQMLLSVPFPRTQYKEPREEYLRNIEKNYGTVAQGCIALQERLGTYNRDRLCIYLEKEEEIRKILSDMPKPAEIEALLKEVGLDINELYKTYGTDKIKSAIKYAKDLKDRYTVLWLYYDLYGDKQ